MGRPTEHKEQERIDTVYWCERIRIFSGLSDAAIERELFPTNNNSVATGKNFNRWAKGQRSMDHDALQLMVRNARRTGLLPKNEHRVGAITIPEEARLNLAPGSDRATEQLKARSKLARKLHKAKLAATAALQAYAAATKNAQYILVFDPSQFDGDGSPIEIYPAALERLAKQIENHTFLPLGG